MIPKTIFQTYPSRRLPKPLLNNVRRIQRMQPGWSYRLFTDPEIEDYLAAHFPDSLSYYFRINPGFGAARADFFRYHLMFREGGVYLDIKSYTTRPLDEVIRQDDTYLLSHWSGNREGGRFRKFGLYRPEIHQSDRWPKRGEYQQWFIICKPDHPLLARVIDRVYRNIDHFHGSAVNRESDLSVFHQVLRTTGPIAYTNAITAQGDPVDARLVDSRNDLGLEYTCLGHPKKHRSLFKAHYTRLAKTVVREGLWRKINFPYRCLVCAKQVYRSFGRFRETPCSVQRARGKGRWRAFH